MLLTRIRLKYITVALTLGAAAAFAHQAMAFEKCSKSKGEEAYKRCLDYYAMAGTPSERNYASSQMANDRKANTAIRYGNCFWSGTSPFCAGSCPRGFVVRSSKACVTGRKVYCCERMGFVSQY